MGFAQKIIHKLVPISTGVAVFLVLLTLYNELEDINFSDKYHVTPGVYETPEDNFEENLGASETVCSEIHKLDTLVETFERTHDWSVAVRVGDMYARGCYPKYSPDDASALKIYTAVSKSPDPEISAKALSRCVDLRTNPVPEADRRGTPLPKETCDRLVSHIDDYLRKVPLSQYLRRRKSLDPIDNNVNNTRTSTSRGPEFSHVEPDAPTDDEPTVTENPVYILDTQNVHDHGVSASVRQNIKAVVGELRETGSGGIEYDRQDVIEEVMKELRGTGMGESDMADAFRVVVSLVPDKINSVGCSQMDVLHATLSKIKKVPDPVIRNNLMESLGKNLASGVERGHVVCSTGKIGRIITTLEGVDGSSLGSSPNQLQKSVPIDVVRNEISALASKVREDVLSSYSEQQVSDYEKSVTSKLSEEMNERFRHQVKETYVKDLHLSEKVLNPIIETYASVF